MPQVIFRSDSPGRTRRIGFSLGHFAQAGDVFLLSGDLGAGKTCITQGIAKGLGVEGYVRSPTFVLLSIHSGRLPLYHVDIYRLDHVAEVQDLGLEEYLAGDGVSVIEWADKALEVFPKSCLRIMLDFNGEKERLIKLEPYGKRYEQLVLQTSSELEKSGTQIRLRQ